MSVAPKAALLDASSSGAASFSRFGLRPVRTTAGSLGACSSSCLESDS